ATTTITAANLVVRATAAADAANDSTSTVTATASSGAAGGASVAGSVAIAVVEQDTLASVQSFTALRGGDLTIEAIAHLESTVRALPVGAGAVGTSVGVGASFGLTVLTVQTGATIGAGVGITGARNVTLTASAVSS